MSWHFLERWVEKANHHSTLVGKFWITFLIVCRIVLIASVGDRVYSDEQSEFKCNTGQPGCSNVCFNKFSPISHLRFWSFQILLVATPTVMFVIYSGHDTKGMASAASGKKKKMFQRKKAHANRRKRVKNTNANANANNNNNNNNSDSNNKCRSRDRRFGTRKNNDAKRRSESNLEADQSNQMRDELLVQAQPVMGTMISFQNGFSGNAIEAMVLSGKSNKHETNVMWKEMKLDSLLPNIRDNTAKNRIDPKAMWLTPKSNDKRIEYNDYVTEQRGQLPLTEENMARMLSCDDNNQNGTGVPDNAGYYTPEANLQPQHNDSYTVQGMEKDDQLALLNSNLPPVYEEHGWIQGPPNNAGPPTENYLIRLRKLRVQKTRIEKPRFTRHFHFYFVTVVTRLLIESLFLTIQQMLYGFKVPSLYKCNEWPCPNVVDCFISRPMEKTIFLQFMYGYSSLCVVLNFFEFLYLTWVYLCGRPKIVKRKNDDPAVRGKPKPNDQVDDDSDLSDSVIGEEEDEERARNRHGKGTNQYGDYGSRKKRSRKLDAKRIHYREKQLEEANAELRRHELDIMMNDDEFQDDFENNPSAANDMTQIDMVSNGVSGGGDDDFGV